jgi:hypothetical protein
VLFLFIIEIYLLAYKVYGSYGRLPKIVWLNRRFFILKYSLSIQMKRSKIILLENKLSLFWCLAMHLTILYSLSQYLLEHPQCIRCPDVNSTDTTPRCFNSRLAHNVKSTPPTSIGQVSEQHGTQNNRCASGCIPIPFFNLQASRLVQASVTAKFDEASVHAVLKSMPGRSLS